MSNPTDPEVAASLAAITDPSERAEHAHFAHGIELPADDTPFGWAHQTLEPFTLETTMGDFINTHVGPKWAPSDGIDLSPEAVRITLESHYDLSDIDNREVLESDLPEWLADFAEGWMDEQDENGEISYDPSFGDCVVGNFQSMLEDGGPTTWTADDFKVLASFARVLEAFGTNFNQLSFAAWSE